MKRIALFLVLTMLFCVPAYAANKVYIAPETAIVWTDSGGDELLDLGGAAAGTSTMGSFADLGPSSRSEYYNFELLIDGFDTAPVVGESVDLYFSQSIATTNFDGNPTTDPTTSAEGTITIDQLKNCMFVGSAVVYSTTVTDELKSTGIVRLTSRYVSVVVHNNTADALESTSETHKVTLIPIPPEVQ